MLLQVLSLCITFSVQLSDAAGSFASPVTIGTLVSNLNNETITCTIPANTASGTGYPDESGEQFTSCLRVQLILSEIISSTARSWPVSVVSDRFGFCSDDAGNITLAATGGSRKCIVMVQWLLRRHICWQWQSLVIPSPSAATTYYTRWATTASNSSCAGVTVSVSSLPTVSGNGDQQLQWRCCDCNDRLHQPVLQITGAEALDWAPGHKMQILHLLHFTPSVSAGSFICNTNGNGNR